MPVSETFWFQKQIFLVSVSASKNLGSVQVSACLNVSKILCSGMGF